MPRKVDFTYEASSVLAQHECRNEHGTSAQDSERELCHKALWKGISSSAVTDRPEFYSMGRKWTLFIRANQLLVIKLMEAAGRRSFAPT